MKVKELIDLLLQHNGEQRVVVDTLEGFLDVYEYVAKGGTRKGEETEKVVVISLVDADEDDNQENIIYVE